MGGAIFGWSIDIRQKIQSRAVWENGSINQNFQLQYIKWTYAKSVWIVASEMSMYDVDATAGTISFIHGKTILVLLILNCG